MSSSAQQAAMTVIDCCQANTSALMTMPIANRPALTANLDVTRPSFDTVAHWRLANQMRGHGNIDMDTRENLRAKARYEYQNNDHFNGLVNAAALYVVGTGPRLSFSVDHLIKDRRNPTLNQSARNFSGRVERKFAKWSKSQKLFIELYTSLISIIVDGESLGVIKYNPSIPGCPCQYKTIDPGRLCNPNNAPDTKLIKGGIVYDAWDNPEYYCILDIPEPHMSNYDFGKYTMVPASQIIHIFVPSFAEQLRGICMMASSLQRLGRLRDFDDSTLEGSKNAASILGVVKTQQGYEAGAQQQNAFRNTQWENFGVQPLARNMWMYLPPTADAEMMEPKPSNVGYTEFVDQQLQAAGHPLQMPKNVATNSSATYNYSSAKMDEQRAFQQIEFLRQLIDTELNDRVFEVFYRYLLEDLLIESIDDAIDLIPSVDDVSARWRYPVPRDIDQSKRESMFKTMLETQTASKRDIIEMRGNDQDWMDVMDQIATEQAYAAEMLTPVVSDNQLNPDGTNSTLMAPTQP